MPRRNHDHDELDDIEFPDAESGDDDLTPCPSCRRPIYEDAERCPYCENWISREDAPGRPPTWVFVGVLVCLAIVATWILAR